ncbi:proteasome-dependent catabolite inactivation protein [Schizosaccharomyces cryophilus OY26]|uniref:Proteasome-dependent catabolite inactivation protein n=1 Tax=Schizosaccharomyces cryophilus (strain OY26 / ATCC MYA-4695 / CBS 11777 / NBRC 106824 / NRRL Y48691) TaxID=653667 RepID=S9X0E6_SCHCR|nr:proteasome-dependent catabolite inactivation protein [Schizosaccharomyces cryophilus OY26]EPY50417.1 proteasome-dependent catabolite inactivation protein [Schizosaccharomyces cryophilus OY26]
MGGSGSSSADIFMSDRSSPNSETWEARCHKIRLNTADINLLVLDYLIIQGNEQGARTFASEAGIEDYFIPGSIRERMEVCELIREGSINSAIYQLNELDPEILDKNSELLFELLRLKLIELIREAMNRDDASDATIEKCLTFATENLAPIAPLNPSFLTSLELTMSLLCFPPASYTPALKNALDPSQRERVANLANLAMLKSQGLPNESRLLALVNFENWCRKQAEKQSVHVPPFATNPL